MTFVNLNTNTNVAGILNKRDHFLPQLLRTNYSEKQAYELIKTRIPYQELLKLQTISLELRSRIMLQPAEERTFSQDVSFQSPLIW